MDPAVQLSPAHGLWHLPAANGGAVEDSSHTDRTAALYNTTTNNNDNTNSKNNINNKRRRRDPSASATAAALSEDESSKLASTTSSGGNELTDSEAKTLKAVKCRDESCNLKAEGETSSGCKKPTDQTAQPSEQPKQDYIHVRARRGQATDSHSLAERARREKISERMKILQDLVPGCNKVIGKASVLDEIINYIQALQRQVEFLSMKLEAVNSPMNPGIEAFPAKEFGGQSYDATTSVAFNSQAAREYGQGPPAEWLHMQVGGAFERVT